MARRRGEDPDDPNDEAGVLFDEYQDADSNGDGVLSPEEAINQFVANSDVEGLVEYLNAPHGEWTSSDRIEVDAALEDLAESNPEFYSVVNSYSAPDTPADQATDQVNGADPLEQQVEQEEASATQRADDAEAAEAAISAFQESIEANPGGRVDLDAFNEYLPSNLPPGTPQAQQWLETQFQAGLDAAMEAEAGRQHEGGADDAEAQARAEAKYGTGGLLPDDIPEWMLPIISQTGGLDFEGNVSPEIQDRLVNYYNDLFGTDFRDFDSLIQSGSLREPTDINQTLLESTLLDVEPTMAFDIQVPTIRGGTTTVHLSQEEVEAYREAGWSTDAITRIVRLANSQQGIDPNTGEPRPVDMAGTAMLARSLGVGMSMESYRQAEQEIEQIQDAMNNLEGRGAGAEYARLRKRLLELQREQMARGSQGNVPNFFTAMRLYNHGLDTYGQNQVLAFIHARDAGLAARIAASGGDPDKMTDDDNAAAARLLQDAGVINRDNTWAGRLGLRSGESILRYLGDYFGSGGRGGGGGGGGATRRLIDPVQVREQTNRLWQAMFRAEADPEIIEAFTKSLQSMLDKAPEGQDFDVSARISEFLKGQGKYSELYGKKASGVSDEEWQGQFVAAQSSILGNEVSDDEAILSGMRTGDYQATVGAAAASKQAMNNSTWRGRLARAGQLVAEMT